MPKDNKKPTDNSKIDKNKNANIVNKKPLSKKFNLKAMKRKAIVGSLVASFGAVMVGGVAITKYSYDQTERVIQFQLKSVSDKKTIVEENCSYKKISSYTPWDGGVFGLSDSDDALEDISVSEGKKKCDIEILDRLVNTSEGVLQNNPSLLDMKDKTDVEVIDKNLKAGYWYEATVKGFEVLGGNNIITVRRLPDDWKQATENLSRTAKPATASVATPKADGSKPASNDSDIELLQRQLEILKIQQQLDDMRRKQQQQEGSGQVIRPTVSAPKPPA